MGVAQQATRLAGGSLSLPGASASSAARGGYIEGSSTGAINYGPGATTGGVDTNTLLLIAVGVLVLLSLRR